MRVRSSVDVLSSTINTMLKSESSRGIMRFAPLEDNHLAQGGITMHEQMAEIVQEEARNELTSVGAAGEAIKKAFNRGRAGLRSTPPMDENLPPQTPTKLPLKLTTPSTDSMKPPSPLNKNENTTRWPTPPQNQGEVASSENTRPKVSFEAVQSSKSGNSSTQPITEGTGQKKVKKRKSLYKLLRGK
ncbi:MAG: hypothetical protein M1821_009973 [Bathelium mastoideum]|nr:MAG: hypothetical protein M1821_009973 [Bathelium mastoideum]